MLNLDTALGRQYGYRAKIVINFQYNLSKIERTLTFQTVNL